MGEYDMAWDWRDCSHVLCVRLDNMGDVLMCSPAFRALKQSGARRLSLLTSASGALLAPYMPEVDTVMAYDAAWIKNGTEGNGQDVAAIARLRALRPDAAVIFTAYSQSALPAALLCHLAGVPRVLAHSRENPYRLLTEWVKETEPQAGIRHEVRRQLDLVASIGAHSDDIRLSFRVSPAERATLREKLHHEGVTEQGGAGSACMPAPRPRRGVIPPGSWSRHWSICVATAVASCCWAAMRTRPWRPRWRTRVACCPG